VGLGVAFGGFPAHSLAEELAVLEVAYAGSMGSLVEGPLKKSAAQTLKLDMHGRAQGANALAPVDCWRKYLAGCLYSHHGRPHAHSTARRKRNYREADRPYRDGYRLQPKEPLCIQLDAAAKGHGNWWEVLQEPGFRFGRSDPSADPQGRNIIFTMMLAAKQYNLKRTSQKDGGNSRSISSWN
jgi:molybdate/tungstate transport system substrate-binding protein